jgi:hypothetical protein
MTMTRATAARLLIGGTCLVAPGSVLAAVGAPDRQDRHVRRITSALGARLVLQAGLDHVRGRPARTLDATIELTHAASMVPVAAIWPRHRRSASVSAAVAAGIAVLDLLDRR